MHTAYEIILWLESQTGVWSVQKKLLHQSLIVPGLKEQAVFNTANIKYVGVTM